MNKICPRCNQRKDFDQFYKQNGRKFNISVYCKDCIKLNNIKNKEKISEYMKRYRFKNKEILALYMRNYKISNKEHLRNHYKIWQKEHKRNNINAKLKHNLSSRINKVIKNNNKSESTVELLGCTILQFKLYLENQFDKNMNWKNYGEYWHIDHVIPCSYYDLSDSIQQKECFNYLNLRPLEAKENIRKSDKI